MFARPGGRRVRARTCSPGSAEPASACWRPASAARVPYTEARPPRSGRASCSAARRRASRTPGRARTSPPIRPADARRCRQPQRLDRRRRPPVRGAAPARRPADGRPRRHRSGTTDLDALVRLRRHRRRPGRRGRRAQGPGARRDRRRRRQALVRRLVPAHRLRAVEVACSTRRRERHDGADYSWQRASERRDYMVNRPAGRRRARRHARTYASLEAAGAATFRGEGRIAARGRRRGHRARRARRTSSRAANVIVAVGSTSKVPPIDGPRRDPPVDQRARRR